MKIGSLLLQTRHFENIKLLAGNVHVIDIFTSEDMENILLYFQYTLYYIIKAIHFIFGLSIRTVEVIVISVVKFFVTCLVSEILKAYDTSRPPFCFIIRSILMTSQQGRLCFCQLVKFQ